MAANYIGHIGRRGAALRRQRLFRACRICGEVELLVGYMCKPCYMRFNARHKYATDAKYRRESIERAARTRRRNGRIERKGKRKT
jgi:hypothetical protein